ncbi:MAG: ferritin-like domain-containing protein [Rivularia sp. (in: cyanobacteria)]
MNQQYAIAGLDLPDINSEDKLNRILSSALEKTNGYSQNKSTLINYWDGNYFNLDKVKIFQYSTPAEQSSILQLCNLGILEEAYFIEKAGMGYMAKMILLAETTEERMLYGLFAADEVTHFSQISSFLPTPKLSNNPFLDLLENVVESDDKTVLLFVLQVVLEGWGLTHYRSIASCCQNPQLKSILQGFLQDESRHHATGVTLFENKVLSNSSQDIVEILAMFLQMVQLGPQSVVKAVEQVKGYLSKEDKINIFAQLDTETHSGSRLKLLRNLIDLPNAKNILENLEMKGSFQPLKPSQCVF